MGNALVEILRKERALVYFYARWSAPSVGGLRALEKAMAARGISSEAVHIFDVDDHLDDIEALSEQGFAFGGWGEAAVIGYGQVRFFSTLGRGGESIEIRVAKFLDEGTS